MKEQNEEKNVVVVEQQEDAKGIKKITNKVEKLVKNGSTWCKKHKVVTTAVAVGTVTVVTVYALVKGKKIPVGQELIENVGDEIADSIDKVVETTETVSNVVDSIQ